MANPADYFPEVNDRPREKGSFNFSKQTLRHRSQRVPNNMPLPENETATQPNRMKSLRRRDTLTPIIQDLGD